MTKCDNHKIKFNRNKVGFKYFRCDLNREALYFPDFFIQEYNVYVEIKGYETDLDRNK